MVSSSAVPVKETQEIADKLMQGVAITPIHFTENLSPTAQMMQ